MVYKSNLNEFRFDLGNIPFPDSFFHMIITSHVLEHVPNITKCLNEIYRILKPGGVGFVAFPMNPKLQKTIEDDGIPMSLQERKKKFGQEDHYRWIGRDIYDILAASGLKRDEYESRQPSHFYHRPHVVNHLKGYMNSEFQAGYSETVWFVTSPVISHRVI